ncbi:4-hydroxyphenylacetate catabolism regulatory protein HpaA [Acinetobacter baylyi]|uniref:4-hydroxyphenylacetate catabolism regulatory protein HpaA n=1 Tax=Acinetobacter baylyi TaxID=202950 RepID=UPI0031E26621
MKDGMIPNLNIGQVYDQRYAESEIHYEALGKLANFFGMQMPVHRHDRFFQLHFLTRGEVRVFLDDVKYVCKAPFFFITPPSVAHSFITTPDCEGHVLTIQQHLIWSLLQNELNIQYLEPVCVQQSQLDLSLQHELGRMQTYLAQLQYEFDSPNICKKLALTNWINLIFLQAYRLSQSAPVHVKNFQTELDIFRKFNELIEDHFKEHWTLAQYANTLAVTETRLNDICKTLADISPKKLIFDRQMQEAKRLLVFTDLSVSEICYFLGFKDPAYFSRFFFRNAGIKAKAFRDLNSEIN